MKAAAAVLCAAALPGTSARGEHPGAEHPRAERPCAAPEVVRARWAMGTLLEVRLRGAAASLADQAFAAAAEVERAASTWRADSELSRLHAGGGGPWTVSEPLAVVLAAAVAARDRTGGLFDPALGALVEAYALHGQGRWPSERERAAAASLAGAGAFSFDPASRVLAFARPGARLDLDGIAKGAALDRAAARLRAAGVRSALLNFGGQVLVIGPPSSCPAERIVVASPDAEARPLLSVLVRDASVATSSNAERARVVEGRPFGHLLDPRTGGFAPFRGSVTVVAPTGAEADALSTALFVGGPESFGAPRSTSTSISIAFLVPEGDGYRALADPGFTPAHEAR